MTRAALPQRSAPTAGIDTRSIHPGLNVLGTLTARVSTTIVTVSQFGSATIDASGRVVFQVAGLSATESWIFIGQLTSDGARVTGRHTLTSSSGSTSGNFTATRQ